MIVAQCLKCWGPKMEWVGYVPTFPINQFELVQCNAGLQVCVDGCKHCVNVTGSFVAKSCAGDHDQGLDILGLDEDGCKNISDVQNRNYTTWINKMIGKLPNYSISADFTQACRCSWDGCNGPPNGYLDDSNRSFSFKASLASKSVTNALMVLFVLAAISTNIGNFCQS